MGDFSFEGGEGGAASGAGLGTAILPGIGTAVGGILGFLGGGLFGGKKAPEQYSNPYKGLIDSQAQELINGNLGKQEAASATGTIRRQAKDNLEEISNTQGMGGNAAVRSRLGSKIGTQADEGIVKAQLGGAELDNQNKSRGLQLMQQQQGFDYNDFLRTSSQKLQPSPLESLGNVAMGTLGGEGIAKAFAPDESGGNSANPAGNDSTGDYLNKLANKSGGDNPLNYQPQNLTLG